MQWFFEELERMLDLVHEQLLERFEIIANKKVYNFPFLMGEGVWLDSEKLNWNDSVREVLQARHPVHRLYRTGGVPEALRGTHHGEDPNSQNLGLEIVGFIRKYCDDLSQKEKLNYTCLATPAEGLSGRFVRIDRENSASSPALRIANTTPTPSMCRYISPSARLKNFPSKRPIMR